MIQTKSGKYALLLCTFMLIVRVLQRFIGNRRTRLAVNRIILVGCCAAALWFSLLSRQVQAERCVFLHPFQSYAAAWQSFETNLAAANGNGTVTAAEGVRSFLYGFNWIILNVFLLLPYGFMLPHAFPERHKGRLILSGIALSVLIELAQYLFRLGCLDVDDVISNAFGVCLGFLLAEKIMQWRKRG